jgi:hypothetical protein
MTAVFMREPSQCRTDRWRRLRRRLVPALATVALAASTAAGAAAWPAFLAPPDAYSPGEVATIRRAWTTPTLHRTVEGPAAPMPLASYQALVDAPDLTAAAARHLGVAGYEVRMLAPGWYEADDHEGAHGVYRVVGRGDGRRVTLSWGSRRGPWLGTISGSALSVMQFEAHGQQTFQRLDVYVVIDNAVLAGLARSLVPIFGHIADRKLTHGFAVSAKVAAWASDRPEEFCAWLREQPLDAARRGHLIAALPRCAPGDDQAARSLTR